MPSDARSSSTVTAGLWPRPGRPTRPARAAAPWGGDPRPPVREDGAICGGRIARRRVEGSSLDDVTGLAPRVGGGGRGPLPRVADQVHGTDPRSPEATGTGGHESLVQRGGVGSAGLPAVPPRVPEAPPGAGGRPPFG